MIYHKFLNWLVWKSSSYCYCCEQKFRGSQCEQIVEKTIHNFITQWINRYFNEFSFQRKVTTNLISQHENNLIRIHKRSSTTINLRMCEYDYIIIRTVKQNGGEKKIVKRNLQYYWCVKLTKEYISQQVFNQANAIRSLVHILLLLLSWMERRNVKNIFVFTSFVSVLQIIYADYNQAP